MWYEVANCLFYLEERESGGCLLREKKKTEIATNYIFVSKNKIANANEGQIEIKCKTYRVINSIKDKCKKKTKTNFWPWTRDLYISKYSTNQQVKLALLNIVVVTYFYLMLHENLTLYVYGPWAVAPQNNPRAVPGLIMMRNSLSQYSLIHYHLFFFLYHFLFI